MKLSTSHALLTLAALLPLGASLARPQDGADQDPKPSPELDLYGRPFKQATKDLERRMRGCWRLTAMDSVEWPTSGRDLLGFLLVADGFLSFEVQAFWDESVDEVPDAYQTFTVQFAVDKHGKVRTQSLIGSYLDREEGVLEWEDPGMPREFEASMPSNSRLELVWGNESRMTFERVRAAGPTAASFFGAPPKDLLKGK